MTTLKRPSRLFSFTDWQKQRPREPIPGDRIDAQFAELIRAINGLDEAIKQIRRDDGELKNASVGADQLRPDVAEVLIKRVEERLDTKRLEASVRDAAVGVINAERSSALYARDAENAAGAAMSYFSQIKSVNALISDLTSTTVNNAKDASSDATDAENWGNYSKAQADNAILAKNESLQWAEYLAGPVVDQGAAPAYIAGSPFPHGLYYQPVQGYGGTGGLWSAKWWAMYAQNLVGGMSIFYLGAWDHPPLPGSNNPMTGQPVPDPLTPGSIYYDTNTHTLYVWTGSGWEQSVSLASGFQARYVYIATDGQTVFSGPDKNGITPSVVNSPSDIHLNGVKLLDGDDYTVDAPTSTLTLSGPVSAGAVIQWDLLVPSARLAPGTINAYKMLPMVPDGTTTEFLLQYIDLGTGNTTDAAVGTGAQLMVLLDGIVQEPGRDYSAIDNTLTMAVAPPADGHFWAIWYQPGAIAP